MEQLSSCYFCGAALDASLDEYPVVPKSLHPDDDEQKTVVLCQGCRRKLGTVVETVVSVVETPESSRTGTDRTSDAAESPVDAGGLTADGAAEAGELSSEDVGDVSTGAAASTDASTDDGGADDGTKDVTYTTSTAAGGRKSVSGEAESIRDAGGAMEGNDGGTTTTAGDEPTSADAGGDGDGTDDGPSLTALENTKVMRLLQNRAFPVDREEIRTVAVNAYDISESQFDAVVDVAVDKGLIDERNGQFVEAE